VLGEEDGLPEQSSFQCRYKGRENELIVGIAANLVRKKAPALTEASFYLGNVLLSHTLGACSTIGAEGLNFRVRDGNGWNPFATVTQKSVASDQWPVASKTTAPHWR
jgi:hypothetical protein